MAKKKGSDQLDWHTLKALRAHGGLDATKANAMLDRLIDDKFGGQMLDDKDSAAIQAILQHVDELERILRS